MSSIMITRKGEMLEISVKIVHATEDGQRRDSKSGKFVPENFVQQIVLKVDDRPVADFNLGANLPDHPRVSVKMRNVVKGNVLVAEWLDSSGKKGRVERKVDV
ncbi:thiosulfate oxidation carrier complex protein SoxZ [Burkholderiaceae bacterium DAT-1]|nr:thiosulfate oxidation carrier complex protein SoxZ [Burkholderiaceae bacterium DAT-1]